MFEKPIQKRGGENSHSAFFVGEDAVPVMG